MTDEIKFTPDAEGCDLAWHALNYRTAHADHAELMWRELERYAADQVRAAVLAERERCALLSENYPTIHGQHDCRKVAAAIRAGHSITATDRAEE